MSSRLHEHGLNQKKALLYLEIGNLNPDYATSVRSRELKRTKLPCGGVVYRETKGQKNKILNHEEENWSC